MSWRFGEPKLDFRINPWLLKIWLRDKVEPSQSPADLLNDIDAPSLRAKPPKELSRSCWGHIFPALKLVSNALKLIGELIVI